MLYITLSLLSGIVSFIASLMIRFELGVMNIVLFTVLQDYNVTITTHGLLMIFFFVMPFAISFVGNLLIPILSLCLDLFFPRLNLLAFVFLYAGLSLVLYYISV